MREVPGSIPAIFLWVLIKHVLLLVRSLTSWITLFLNVKKDGPYGVRVELTTLGLSAPRSAD